MKIQRMRLVGLSMLPAVILFTSAAARAKDAPKEEVATHATPSGAPNVKIAPARPAPGSAVTLNPQPIPPGKSAAAPAAPAAPAANSNGDKAIIFVGGKGSKLQTAPGAAPAAEKVR